ncbi:SSI family serine proteinase inhibitor [Streptomyces sp. AM8-1-1]|uniref:SSI family serine proteinase inhibitor n=1 Tax=Streptomyces sp. AM8-1-1 TaxID=3075825 RepID=UPI0028C418E6|nr:SSI family serine proteinase inhibitor [Streptomyces sp. AM8-1-1]WNO73637.1 SSI family serine proteinase inhibitor [Streptomyces sp. AM8-1-1]
MLRRLVLTATVTAAALAGAVPAAGATPLPFPLPLLSAPDPDRLTVIVSDTGNTRTDGTYELMCDPAGGTHPAAAKACARLDELAKERRNPFAPVPEDQMCTMQSGGPATARVTGTWQGQRVDATFNRANGCEISRWRTMEPVLPNTRS